jgi:REP element-mobilizing transposase RayT
MVARPPGDTQNLIRLGQQVFSARTPNFRRLVGRELDFLSSQSNPLPTTVLNPSVIPLIRKSQRPLANERIFYHVTMQPHRRIPALYAEVEAFVRELIIDYTRGSEFDVWEVGVVPTHIHILVEKAPWADLLVFIKDFQRHSSDRIFAQFPELMRDMHTNRFWTDGGFHYVRHTEASLEKARAYIRGQKKHHGLQ